MSLHAKAEPAAPESENTPPLYRDEDQDSMQILPIWILPVTHPALRRARLIKNARLETVVELFNYSDCGSGQVTVRGLPKVLGLPVTPPHPDIILLGKISELTSFDVYSLRILLRDCAIKLEDESVLHLSQAKIQSLSVYMAKFTRPLIAEVFGEDATVKPFTDVLSLFRDCGVNTVRERLAMMAGKLGIEVMEIPKFLEDYADIFMSLSYYRHCLDEIMPHIEQFMSSLADLRQNYQLKTDTMLMNTLDLIEETINGALANVTGRLESFERSTNDMWNNLTAERYRKIETMIRTYHTSIGGVLCSLSVKLSAWARQFPAERSSGPVRRAEFIMQEMRQGIERIQAIEDAAPMLAGLNS
jgi:hypothetical protein